MKHLRLILSITLAAVVVSGCRQNLYQVDMEASDDGFQRTMQWDVTKHNDSSAAETQSDTTLMSRIYKRQVTKDKQFKGSGKFIGRTPNDVGGNGWWVCYPSAFGTTWAYIEEFRGQDDAVLQLNQMFSVVDKITNMLSDWLGSEMGKDPNFPKLDAFINKDLRHDLRNVITLFYAYQITKTESDEEKDSALLAVQGKIAAYLLKRNYISIKEIPLLARASEEAKNDSPEMLLNLFHRVIARRMGIADDKPLPQSLAFLKTQETIVESLTNYMKTLPEVKKTLAEIVKDRDQKQPSEKDFEDAFGKVMEDICKPVRDTFMLFLDYDTVDLTLKTKIAPHTTNGLYDPEINMVTWSNNIELRSDKYFSPPAVCYAIWAEADKKAQQKHLGQVCLEGEELMQYCLWRAALTPAEAKEWQGLVKNSTSRKNLVPADFKSKIPTTENAKPYWEKAIELLEEPPGPPE